MLFRWSVSEYLYIFGYETPRQRRNNATHGWDDEDSHGVLIDAPDESSALAWGDQIAQRYISVLFDGQVDWLADRYASFIELEVGDIDWPRVPMGEFPPFDSWLMKDRM